MSKLNWTDYVGYGAISVIVIGVLFVGYMSVFGLPLQTSGNSISAQSTISLPANVQSSAPMKFNSFEEEVEFMKKNAKNPMNIDIERAVRNMDANLDGQCDTCGMAILHCIEQGMEDM